MFTRTVAAIVAASLLCPWLPAQAENQMGYRLLSVEEAARLPRNQGALGLDVERAQQISDGGMTFDVIRVKQVRRQSAGDRAGLRPGDQIIALDGRVFPTLTAFGSYISSAPPGSQMTVDYMPAGGGPQQAQRLALIVGQAGQAMAPVNQSPPPERERSEGMSTGTKLAIGAGAVALFGCYEMGCFSHRRASANQTGHQQPVVNPNMVPQAGMAPR